MEYCLQNTSKLKVFEWDRDSGLVSPEGTVGNKSVSNPPPDSMSRPRAAAGKGTTLVPRRGLSSLLLRPKFVVPTDKKELDQMLRHLARTAASKNEDEEAEPDDEAEPADEETNSRKSTNVDPYNAMHQCLRSLFDKSSGVVPSKLSTDAHTLQVQLLDAVFADDGPLCAYSSTMQGSADTASSSSSTGLVHRTSVFYSKAKVVAMLLYELTKEGMEGWDADIAFQKGKRSKKRIVVSEHARYSDYSPTQPVYRVVYTPMGQRSPTFVDEILRDKHRYPQMELFATDFYSTLTDRISTARDDRVNKVEGSRAKKDRTSDVVDTKHKENRRAYPIMGPLEYHVYVENKSVVASIADFFDSKTGSQLKPLTDAVRERCAALSAKQGFDPAKPVQEYAQKFAKQHHYQEKMQRACVLFGELFATMIDPSANFMITDYELRNGIYVLTSLQSNSTKDSEDPNSDLMWTIKVVHHILNIQDPRLKTKNFVNETQPPVCENERKHVDGSLGSKIDDCVARIQANCVSLVVEKILAYMRLRFLAFTNSNQLFEDWEKEASSPAISSGQRRNMFLHHHHVHKADPQAGTNAFSTDGSHASIRKKKAPQDASDCGKDNAAPSAEVQSTGLIVVDGVGHQLDSATTTLAVYGTTPSVGSDYEMFNLENDCEIIAQVVQYFVPEVESGDGSASSSSIVVTSDDREIGSSRSGTSSMVVLDETYEPMDEEENMQHALYVKSCNTIGWMALGSRKSIDALQTSCDSMLLHLRQAKKVCDDIVDTYAELKPLYEKEHAYLMNEFSTLREKTESQLQPKDQALLMSNESHLMSTAYDRAAQHLVEDIESVCFANNISSLRLMLGPPNKWSELLQTVQNDIKNIDATIVLLYDYKSQIETCAMPTFFDYGPYLTPYVDALCALRQNTSTDVDSDTEQPYGLANHDVKKTNFKWVDARLKAFHTKRDDWNSAIMKSMNLGLGLCGAWTGLDHRNPNLLPESKRTHVKPGVSALLYMLTVCEVEKVLLVTENPSLYEQFCKGQPPIANNYLMAVLAAPDKRRHISIAPYVEKESSSTPEGIRAFASHSKANWTALCCMAEIVKYVLVHARNKVFDRNNVCIAREECTVLLYDDDRFVHTVEAHRNAAVSNVEVLKSKVRSSYPLRYAWNFSDLDIVTKEHLLVLCMSVPSILNEDSGFINYSGVKDRYDDKNGMYNVAKGKLMSPGHTLWFDIFFYDDEFGTVFSNRKRSMPSSSDVDKAHTPEMDSSIPGPLSSPFKFQKS